jgi:hypothetical protein
MAAERRSVLCHFLVLDLRCLSAIGCDGGWANNIAAGAHEMAGVSSYEGMGTERLRVSGAVGRPGQADVNG